MDDGHHRTGRVQNDRYSGGEEISLLEIQGGQDLAGHGAMNGRKINPALFDMPPLDDPGSASATLRANPLFLLERALPVSLFQLFAYFILQFSEGRFDLFLVHGCFRL